MTEIKKLPLEYKLLKMIAGYIDDYFGGMENPKIARASDIYDFLSRKENFKKHIPDSIHFSRFLRDMYEKRLLKQFIPNCYVDTALHHHYKWHFYPKNKELIRDIQDPNCIKGKAHASTNDYKSDYKLHEAANGVKVRSLQELHIMNSLIAQSDFEFIMRDN